MSTRETGPHAAASAALDRDGALVAKRFRLRQILRECRSVCIGFSGGVDSSYLAKVAVGVLGADHVLAVTGVSAAYPSIQQDAARSVARRFGIPHLEVDTAELDDPGYTANAPDRCYFCKDELWRKLQRVAQERDLAVLLEGSNADDATDFRPGMRAAREHGVRSPLLEAGLSKGEIRELSQREGLPTWDQPSSPCLSSRIAHGIRVTPERLRQVEGAEAALRAHGFREFRVRHHGDVARLEIAPAELAAACTVAEVLNATVREHGFRRVLLDVEGYRRGALHEGLPLVELKGRHG